MIPNVGIMEIAIVLVIALIVFGPKRLPELGKSLGRGISEFKDGVNSIGDSVNGDARTTTDDEPVELTAQAEARRSGRVTKRDPERDRSSSRSTVR